MEGLPAAVVLIPNIYWLVTTKPDANRHELVGWAHNHGVPELAVPRRIIHVGDVPVLGTGKTDYTQVQAMVQEAMASGE